MCWRCSPFAPPEDIEERFGATFADPFEPRYNAAPRQPLPAIPDAAPETIETMEGGFVPPWADDRSEFGFINARAETPAEKPTFRDAFRRDSAGDLLGPYPAGETRAYPVSRRVNDPSNDSPAVVERIENGAASSRPSATDDEHDDLL